MKQFPELIENFDKIDIDNDKKITWEELKLFWGGTSEWLEFQLDHLVGLPELKDKVREFYRSMELDRIRNRQGHHVTGMAKAPHMIFQGSPGTGKTKVGRMMAELLRRIGIIKTDKSKEVKFKEVQRADLVAEHVGQTGPKTKAAVEEAKDGVLFVDEAYRLTNAGGTNDFGTEAVDTLMEFMNDGNPIMIFAGYEKDMHKFMQANQGLHRRIPFVFDFTDYSPTDLAHIFEMVTTSKGFEIEAKLLTDDRKELAKLIEANTTKRTRSFMNGGLCELIFDAARRKLDARTDKTKPGIELSGEDIKVACREIPEPPQAAASSGSASGVAPPAGVKAPLPNDHAPLLKHISHAATTVSERNVWFHIERCEELHKPCSPFSRCFSGFSHVYVSVRLGGKEVHRTAAQPICQSEVVWQETRIVPYSGEELAQFVVYLNKNDGQNYLGEVTHPLGRLEAFNDELILRREGDMKAGHLLVKLGWQNLASSVGAELLRSCLDAGSDRKQQ